MAVDPRDPLTTVERVALWAQESVEDMTAERYDFCAEIIAAVSAEIRDAGDPDWTDVSAPPVIIDFAVRQSKDYFVNSRGLVSEGVGPLSERIHDDFINNISLTAEQREWVADQAGKTSATGPPASIGVFRTCGGLPSLYRRLRATDARRIR